MHVPAVIFNCLTLLPVRQQEQFRNQLAYLPLTALCIHFWWSAAWGGAMYSDRRCLLLIRVPAGHIHSQRLLLTRFAERATHLVADGVGAQTGDWSTEFCQTGLPPQYQLPSSHANTCSAQQQLVRKPFY